MGLQQTQQQGAGLQRSEFGALLGQIRALNGEDHIGLGPLLRTGVHQCSTGLFIGGIVVTAGLASAALHDKGAAACRQTAHGFGSGRNPGFTRPALPWH